MVRKQGGAHLIIDIDKWGKYGLPKAYTPVLKPNE